MNTNYKASEQDVLATVIDFQTFCHYIEERQPMLSKQKEVLGKNDLFKINGLLHFRKEVSAPNYQQESYPVIDLMFNLAVSGKLYLKTGDIKGNVYLERTIRKDEFNALNSFEKYSFLFETFWTRFDFTEGLRWGDNQIQNIVAKLAKSRPGQKLFKGAFSNRKDFDVVFSYNSIFIKYFNYFGFCNVEEILFEPKKFSKYEDNIQEVIPTEFGVSICKILEEIKLTEWNIPYLKIFGYIDWRGDDEDEKNEGDNNSANFHLGRFLEPAFPENTLVHEVEAEPTKLVKGSFVFQVSLGKSVWRKIKVSSTHSLEDFHLAIQEAFSFDNDHLYSFFMDGKKYSLNAYHSLMGDEGPFTDEAIIGELGLYIGQKILYYFDYGDSWEFAVQILLIEEEGLPPQNPEIIERKGKAPAQYPDYDDWDEDN